MRLTLKRLEALEGAVAAMCSGMEGEGDWPEGVTMEAMNDAHDWVCEQIAKRAARPHQPEMPQSDG